MAKIYLRYFDIVKGVRKLSLDPTVLTFALTVIFSLLIIIFSKNIYLEHWNDLLLQLVAEAHGFILDILVLGFLFVRINQIADRKKEISQCLEDIEDLRLKSSDIELIQVEMMSEKTLVTNNYDNLNPEPQFAFSIKGSPIWNSEYVRIKISKAIKKLARHKMNSLDLHCVNVNGGRFLEINLRKSNLNTSLFMDCKLSKSNFSLVSCHDTSFNGSCLEYADFEEANAIGASFVNCNLNYTKFTTANLISADFSNAFMNYTRFNNADLTGANFSKAHLMHCDFRGAKGINANMFLKVKWKTNCKFDPDIEKSIKFLEQANRIEAGETSGQKSQLMKVQKAV